MEEVEALDDHLINSAISVNRLRTALRQKGALRWHLVEHVEQPGRMLESFTMATWSEYKRLAERTTIADKDLLDALNAASGSDLPEIQAHRIIKVSSPDKIMIHND